MNMIVIKQDEPNCYLRTLVYHVPNSDFSVLTPHKVDHCILFLYFKLTVQSHAFQDLILSTESK